MPPKPNSKGSTSSKGAKANGAAGATASKSAKPASSPRTGLSPALRFLSALIALGCAAFVVYDRYGERLPFKLSWTSGEDAAAGVVPDEEALQQEYYQVRPTLPFDLPTRQLPATPGSRDADVEKQQAVKAAFKHSWDAYRRDAWGDDEYHPLSQKGSNLSHTGGIGYTIVDSLDSLLIMGFTEEYKEARDWVIKELSLDRNDKFNLFETTIRVLGGFLSAHALCAPIPSGIANAFNTQCDDSDAFVYLTAAAHLGEKLHPAFLTKTGVPNREVNLHTGHSWPDTDNYNSVSLAEVTTLQLEFRYLGYLTNQEKWWRLAEAPMQVVRTASQRGAQDGLLPIFLDPETGQFMLSDIRLGSRGDSYYEYLLKQYLQTNRTEPVYRDMYDRAASGIKKHLLRQSVASIPPFIHTAEISPYRPGGSERAAFRLVPKQDHLVCFIGGSFMLGASEAQSPSPPASLMDLKARQPAALEDWTVGHEITRTCVETYNTKTGLSPEIAMFRMPHEVEEMKADGKVEDWFIKQPPPAWDKAHAHPLIDARSILRPETVESLFIAYQLSGDPIYRQWGWDIFQAFETHAKVASGGYASVQDVEAEDVVLEDKMETFWLSETLKYLYLLFSDQDLLPLDKWVFNTEAHPLPILSGAPWGTKVV